MTKTTGRQRVSHMGGYAPSYDGTAARVLDGAVVGKTRTGAAARERTRARATTRTQVEVREAGFISPFAVLGFAAIGIVAFLLVFSCAQITVLTDQVISMENELVTLQEAEATLLTQYELAYDLRGVEFVLTDETTMTEPRADQIVYVDVSSPDTVTYYAQTQSDGIEGALDAVVKMGEQVVEYFR